MAPATSPRGAPGKRRQRRPSFEFGERRHQRTKSTRTARPAVARQSSHARRGPLHGRGVEDLDHLQRRMRSAPVERQHHRTPRRWRGTGWRRYGVRRGCACGGRPARRRHRHTSGGMLDKLRRLDAVTLNGTRWQNAAVSGHRQSVRVVSRDQRRLLRLVASDVLHPAISASADASRRRVMGENVSVGDTGRAR